MRTKILRPFGFYFATAAIAVACGCDPRLSWGQRFALLAAAWWIPAVHELGHATLAVLLRMPVLHAWAVPGFGRTRVVSRGRQVEFGLVALAGPLAGIAGALLVRAFAHATGPADGITPVCRTWLDCIALAGALESAANLMPFSPLLDGAKAWRALRASHTERTWRRRMQDATPVAAAPEPVGCPTRIVWGAVRHAERTAWCARLVRGHASRRARVRITAEA